MKIGQRIWALVCFSGYRARRAKRRYEEIKKLVVSEHLNGFGGMVVPRRYSYSEVKQSFKPPMYHLARNPYKQLCLFWRKELMNEEVGPPLKERETASLVSGGTH